MTALLIAALTVLPADRMAMADRLFNKGSYADARAEYATLVGEQSVAGDETLYRLAECDRMLGRNADARKTYGELLEKYPASRHADRVRLMRALVGTTDERKTELRALDSDRVAGPIRAIALYHLGTLTGDADCLNRSIQADPKGQYATYAAFHRAAILAKSQDAKQRREAIAALTSIAFGGGDATLANEALYLAATQSYSDKSYGEAGILFHRYLKTYAGGKHAAEARRLAAWSDYLAGKYADALALCGDGTTDDLAYLKATCTQASGDSAAAAQLFRKYLEDHPQGQYRASAELPLARIGFASAEKDGDAAKTIENARRAYALSHDAADGLRLAWAYEKAGKTDEAAAEYAALAKAKPRTAEGATALFQLAMIRLREEKWSAADMALAEALATDTLGSRKATALYWRGIAANQLDHEAEGATFLREAIKTGPLSLDETREARLILADLDCRAGKTDAAKAEYAKLVAEGACDRMSAAKIRQVGRMLDGDGARTCAKALIGNAAAEWRQSGYALLGELEEKAQAFTAAIDAYRKAVAEQAQTEDLAVATLHLGILETRVGEHAAAAATLDRAVKLAANDPRRRAEAYLALARNSAANGDAKGAQGYATVVTALFDDKELCAEAEKIIKDVTEKAQ